MIHHYDVPFWQQKLPPKTVQSQRLSLRQLLCSPPLYTQKHMRKHVLNKDWLWEMITLTQLTMADDVRAVLSAINQYNEAHFTQIHYGAFQYDSCSFWNSLMRVKTSLSLYFPLRESEMSSPWRSFVLTHTELFLVRERKSAQWTTRWNAETGHDRKYMFYITKS